jgi:hypothetical protein
VPDYNSTLGNWCNNTRQDYKHWKLSPERIAQQCFRLLVQCSRQFRKKGKLSQERIAQLDAMGFCWSPHDVAWEQNPTELTVFFKANGRCRVPNRHPLRGFVSNVRIYYAKGKLSQERITQLEAIDFYCNPYVITWEKNYAKDRESRPRNISAP